MIFSFIWARETDLTGFEFPQLVYLSLLRIKWNVFNKKPTVFKLGFFKQMLVISILYSFLFFFTPFVFLQKTWNVVFVVGQCTHYYILPRVHIFQLVIWFRNVLWKYSEQKHSRWNHITSLTLQLLKHLELEYIYLYIYIWFST